MELVFNQIIEFIRKEFNEPKAFIPLHAPVFQGNEMAYLQECIQTTFVSSVGKFVDDFEIQMAEYTGAKKAVACVNGTSALYLALKLVGVERDHEVLTQPLTFIATANAIAYHGAKPVFLDIDPLTLGLSVNSLERWLDTFAQKDNQSGLVYNRKSGRRIAACLPVHTFGHPLEIQKIVELCERWGIPVVEDAAESVGGFSQGKHTGTLGRIGVLSFNGNKILTCGGGGMLLFSDEKLAARAKHLTTQAKVAHPWEFDHDEIGYNYRMPNLNAAVGLAQLEKLPEFLKSKRKLAHNYADFFTRLNAQSNVSNFILPIVEPKGTQSNYWLNTILAPTHQWRDEFLAYSNSRGVMTRPAWKLMSDLNLFAACQHDDLNVARDYAKRLINLPSSVILSK
jgi:perosamine synthetase